MINFKSKYLLLSGLIIISNGWTSSALTTPQEYLVQAGTHKQQQRQSSWDKIRDIFRRRREDGSTHGDEFCTLSPYIAEYVIWRDQPLFAWKGKVKKIVVIFENDEATEILWSASPPEMETSILYDGKPLEPNQEYYIEYEIVEDEQTNLTSTVMIPFMVMEADKRQEIQNQLKVQELDIRDRETNIEDFALQRAVFFAEQELFLDVVAELFSISSSSPDWNRQIEVLGREFCQ